MIKVENCIDYSAESRMSSNRAVCALDLDSIQRTGPDGNTLSLSLSHFIS